MTITHSFRLARDFDLNGTAKAFPAVCCHHRHLYVLLADAIADLFLFPGSYLGDREFLSRPSFPTELTTLMCFKGAVVCRLHPARRQCILHDAKPFEPTGEGANEISDGS